MHDCLGNTGDWEDEEDDGETSSSSGDEAEESEPLAEAGKKLTYRSASGSTPILLDPLVFGPSIYLNCGKW